MGGQALTKGALGIDLACLLGGMAHRSEVTKHENGSFISYYLYDCFFFYFHVLKIDGRSDMCHPLRGGGVRDTLTVPDHRREATLEVQRHASRGRQGATYGMVAVRP